MSWLRRNRWWLVAVPFCLVAMLAASGYRVQLWYHADLHRLEGSAAAGRPVTVTDHYTDAYGDTSRTFTVRLTSITAQARMPGFDGTDTGDPPPPGTQALAAHLSWSAEPDQSLDNCIVALVDDQGRRYLTPPLGGQVDGCVPDGHAGPEPPTDKSRPRGYVAPGTERPATWTTTVVFAVPQDVHITRALLWWTFPRYVELEAP